MQNKTERSVFIPSRFWQPVTSPKPTGRPRKATDEQVTDTMTVPIREATKLLGLSRSRLHARRKMLRDKADAPSTKGPGQ